MKKFFTQVVRHRRLIMALFVVMALIGIPMQNQVSVNYDLTDYLPSDSASTIALDVMEEEFDGGIPNARVMIYDVSIAEALEYKEAIEAVDGVDSVTWLDDSVDITVPLSTVDTDVVETYYKDGTALFSVTIDDDLRISAVDAIREIIGDDNAMTGSAVTTAVATTNTVSEISKITVIAVLFALLVLILTTRSWAEPFLVLASLGVAILINAGTNLIFGEISFVTNAAGNVLLLAVSMDYSVFLLHRFEECRETCLDPGDAMAEACCKSVSSILSSGLTTVIGFLALVIMRYRIGMDLGLVLAKGVVISLCTVFIFSPGLIVTFYRLIDRGQHRRFLPSFGGFGRFVRRLCVPMVITFLIIVAPAYLASNANAFYYGASKMYGTETQLGADTAAIEEVFGENDTYVLLVPADDLATQTELSDALHDLDHVTDIISYVDQAGAEVPTAYLDEDTLSLLISENYSRFVISVDVPYEGDETFALVEAIRATAESYYPDSWYLAGEGVSTYDLKDTVVEDMAKINVVVIAAVFIVLVLTMRSITIPIMLVLAIETAIWLNLSCPYFMDQTVFYIAYLIITSIQLGSTVDYAILLTDRYQENRLTMDKKTAVSETLSHVTVSILTSGSVMTVVGLLMGYVSTQKLLAQLGIFIGRGAIFSLIMVLFVLPGMLYLLDARIMHDQKRKSVTFMQMLRREHRKPPLPPKPPVPGKRAPGTADAGTANPSGDTSGTADTADPADAL